MTRHWFQSIVAGILAALVLVDFGLILRITLSARSGRADVSVLRDGMPARNGQTPAAFDGMGVRIVDSPRNPVGWAVRYASRRCGYCLSDAHWVELSSELRLLGVSVLVVLPRAEDEFLPNQLTPPGVPQATFISMGWIERFRLTFTPTLLVVDSRGRPVWQHEGTLTAADVTSALAAIRAMDPRGQSR